MIARGDSMHERTERQAIRQDEAFRANVRQDAPPSPADQLTKLIVSRELSLDEALKVVGPFSIHHVQNSGIAFGLFANATGLVTALTALAVGWMLVFFARSGARHPVLPVALGLLIGGSSSNLVDRIRLGHVTDFLDFRYWPAFNLADTFIVVGVGILFAAILLGDARR